MKPTEITSYFDCKRYKINIGIMFCKKGTGEIPMLVQYSESVRIRIRGKKLCTSISLVVKIIENTELLYLWQVRLSCNHRLFQNLWHPLFLLDQVWHKLQIHPLGASCSVEAISFGTLPRLFLVVFSLPVLKIETNKNMRYVSKSC